MPHILRKNMTDGVYRYTSEDGGVNMAVFKEGAEYHIYDYDSGKISRSLTSQEVNKVLRDVRQGVVSQTSEVIEGTQKRYAVSENNIVSTESGMAVEISLDSEIQVELSNATPEERGEIVERVLKQAMLEEGSYEFHDGTKAIMDNKDIAKVGHSKNEIKNRSSVSMKDLVKVARIYAEDWNISHKKFSGFKYYRARVIIEGELYECSLNVGYGKFDKQYHIYDVNQFENAKRSDSPILSNPRKSVEQTVSRTITSKDSITDSTENVNRNAEKFSEIPDNLDTSDLDGYARENIKDYDKLSAPNQAEIRAMIREGRALGMSDGDVLLYAKISARTGVRVTFDKGKTLIGRRKGTRELVYADGFYDPATNEICVNPDGKRSADKLLIHELAHAIYGGEKGMRLAKRNVKNLSAEEKKAISDRYAEVDRTDEIELLDEYNAHYAEGILGNAETLERLLDDAPTVKDRILDFLRGAKGDTDAQRSAAARRLFFKYKRLFDKFAQQNAQNIAAERLPTVATDTEKKTPRGEAPEANGVTRTNNEKLQDSGKRYAIERISEAIDKALANKGDIGEKFNQKKISEVPRDIATVVSTASEGKIDLSEKFISVNGSDIWHEYQRHKDTEIEINRDQIAFTSETIKEAVSAIYDPDIVESVFADANNPTQRQSFAYAKKSPDGHYVVVEAVGGKRNPNVVPVMIIQVSERKWNRWIENGKTLGDMLYENDQEKLAALNIAFNKKNRVTVAQFASKEAIANTPRSPQFNNSIPDSEEKVKRNSEISSKKRFALTDVDGFVDIYTEEEYNNFGWARDADAISVKELDDLYSKIQEKGTLRRFKRTANGEAIVEVNNKPRTTLDVDNVFVFVKGTKNFPEITRVLRVSLFSETDMEKVRKFIYDNEKYPNARTGIASRGIFFEEGLISEYSRRNCQNYQEYRSQIRQRSGRSEGAGDSGAYRNGDFGSGVSEKTNGNVKFALPEDSDTEKKTPHGEAPEANGVTRTNNEKLQVSGKRYAIPVGDEIVDAKTVTEQDVRTLLDNAFNKQYRDGSYIPVRVNTPSVLIEAAQSLGKSIDNLPIILNVGKARQMMSSQLEWVLEQKRGTAHDFTADDVIALIKAMDKPKHIIYQSVDERYVEVVEFETERKQKAVAVLEIGESKKSEYLNGYESGFYQILVTAFEPDAGYVETLLNKSGNIKIYPKKKKGASQSGSGNRVPSHLNESPFATIISENGEKSNTFGENSSEISSKKRFALSDMDDSVEIYTEEEYNNFGWARANDILSAGQNKDYRSKFAKAINGEKTFTVTTSGEYMIPVSDVGNPAFEGVNNTIVYAKGTIDDPIITRVLKIDAYDETTLDEIRRYVYAFERRGVQPEVGGVFHFYAKTDGKSSGASRRGRTENEGYHDRLGADRGTGSREAQGAARIAENLEWFPVAERFTDVRGKKRNVRKLNHEYMVEGTMRIKKLFPTIQQAIDAENESIIQRYAKKYEHSVSWVKSKLEKDSDFLKKEIRKGKRFALPDMDDSVDIYTEEEYNNFGWARANDILSAGQNKDYRSKFAKAINGEKTFTVTTSGEYMIPVSDVGNPAFEGVNNTIVYAKGTIDGPIITRVLKIDAYDETTLDEKRREVYAFERRGIQPKAGEFFKFYARADVETLRRRQGNESQNDRHHNRLGADRGTGSREAHGAARIAENLEWFPVVDTFTDVRGKKRNVRKLNHEYMVEGTMRIKRFFPTVQEAIKGENDNIIQRYARKYDSPVSWVKSRLENDPDFLKKEIRKGKRFALPDMDDFVDIYTEEEYNNFGWARDAEAISVKELDDLYSKIQEKGSLRRFKQSASGEAIVEVNNKPNTILGANNVFVFVKGTKNNPEITRVVRINFFDEESIDIFRKDIYNNNGHRTLEAYARGIGEEFLRYYDRSDNADYRAYTEKSRSQRSRSEGTGDSGAYRNGDFGSGASEKTNGNVKFALPEDSDTEKKTPREERLAVSDEDRLDKNPAEDYNESQGGDTSGNQRSKDTPPMDKQGDFWGVNRGKDGLWEQSQDPEEVYQRLADCQANKGRNGKERAGSSGWFRNTPKTESALLRSSSGFLRDLRGVKLNKRDSAGRPLNVTDLERLKESVIKAQDGTILSLYHWTDQSFSDFAIGDIGFHFGTLDAANNIRLGSGTNGVEATSCFKEVYLNIKNPAIIRFDPMGWHVFPAAYKLNEIGIMSDFDITRLENLEGFYQSSYDSPAAVEFRRMMQRKGYDGIIYTNTHEGDLSIIAFEPNQVITVAENGIDLPRDDNGKRFALPEDSGSADVMAEFSKEMKDQLNEEADRESEIGLARARAEDAAAKEISRVKKTEAKRADYWKGKAKENESRAKVLGNISNLAGKMKDLKLGTYHNATQDQSKQFAGSVEGLSKIVWNGNLSVKLARKHIGTLRAWYKNRRDRKARGRPRRRCPTVLSPV